MTDFARLYDAERFRAHGHRLVDALADHLARAHARAIEPVMPRLSPRDAYERYPAEFPTTGDGDVTAALVAALDDATALHSPRFVGHQVAIPLPDAVLADAVAAFTNNGMAVFEMGKAGTAMERAVLAWMADAVGFPRTAGGVLTSGGSLGNLTALLAARQACTGTDLWRRGVRAAPPLAIVVGESAHYSIARTARVLGLGDDGVVTIPVDERYRMIPAALDDALVRVAREKRTVLAVVASAGSTMTGAIDPIAEIADVCARHRAWLHVDGAHGASLAISPTLRARLAGIERADSVVWDAHKLMLMPALVTAVLFRDAARGAAAFAQEAGYLFDDDDRDAGSDVGRRTFECTKRWMSLKLYACLRALGTQPFVDHVENMCALAVRFADRLAARGFDVMTAPACDIVVFRPRGLSGGQVAAVRRRLLDDGRFYLVQVHDTGSGTGSAAARGGLWLRCALLHPLTTDDDLALLVDETARIADEIRGSVAASAGDR